jgi:hypothetical protein
MERGRGPPRLTYGFQALRSVPLYYKSFCLGRVFGAGCACPKTLIDCEMPV